MKANGSAHIESGESTARAAHPRACPDLARVRRRAPGRGRHGGGNRRGEGQFTQHVAPERDHQAGPTQTVTRI